MKPVVCIAGPTASGKSALALEVAKAVNGEIINADALQVYSDIRILSARPSNHEMADIPHHLYGYVEGSVHYSGGQWIRAVMPVILDILARGKIPILVGGTGLYFKSLLKGLAPVPDVDPALVAEIDARILNEGIDPVMEEARRLDPKGTGKLLGQDPQRLTRLLSVVKQTGRTLQEWQSQTRPEISKHFALGFVMMPPRETLYKRINERFEDMVEQGGMDEAKQVFDRYGGDASFPMVKAIGLSHLLRHLTGELSYDEAIILAKRDTRRFAKRQMTWFRNQSADWEQLQNANVEPILQSLRDWRPI
jgi:tRNA dimethylallyltransferase